MESDHRTPVAKTDPNPSPTSHHAYWIANLRTVASLLVIWFAISFGCGILFARPLNATQLPGTSFKLGFWFAQQGAIFGFVVLVGLYVLLMNRLDRRFDVEEQ